MKPDFDRLAADYQDSTSVVIGDVDCTVEKDLCATYDVKGYPTLKYFLAGEVHDYKAGRDFEGLNAFVVDNLAAQCTLKDEKSCSPKEREFISKWTTKSKDEITKELARLQGMKDGKMNADAKKFLLQRISILTQLSQ
jgi:protein disulfide-isomerase A6